MMTMKLPESSFKLEAVLIVALSLMPLIVGLLFFILKRLWP
jgi:hypothetical protein